jgi:HYR domain-containing protein
MKRAAFGVLCLFVLVPAAAFAQINSFGPTSFYSFEFEQNATIHGVDLFGDIYGAPDSDNIFLSTQLIISGPAGTLQRDIGGGFRVTNTVNDTIFVNIPDETLLVEGHYSVTIVAHDDTGDRLIGPVFYDVIARPVVPQPPLLGLPENVFAEATSSLGAHVSFDIEAFSFVDPAPVVTCDHHSGDLFPIGETSVHCSATDSSMLTASGSFTVFVLDTGGPTVTVPADIVTGNPVVTFTVTATDVIDGPVTAICNPHSGETFDLGTTLVQCIAYDSQGNAGFGSFNVTVSNGPVLTLPSDITAEATSASGAAVSYTVTATDNASIVCTPASGSTFALGTTAVNCTATATTGTTSGSFNITVRDTTPPTITAPDVTAEATGPSGAAVTYNATATDLVDGSDSVSCDHASGSTFPLGTTTVQCTATDAHNNTAHKSFLVTVRDTTPPTIVSITANPSSLWPPNHKPVAVTVTVIASDLVDPNPTSHITSVSSNQPINGIGDGNTTTDWTITGPLTLKLLAERTGGADRVYTITIETTDFSGNTAHGTVTVTVPQSRSRAVH